jgi:hypothetical protein
MAGEVDLQTHFDTIGFPPVVQSWLLELWNVIQVLDDAHDGDKASADDVTRATWAVFQTMPMNAFFREYATVLQPILWLQLLKWEAANTVEALGLANEKSYCWRAGYYEVVLMCCHLCGMKDMGHACMEMYGERYADYMADQQPKMRRVV